MFTNPLNRKYQTGGSIDDEGFYNWLKSNVKEFKDYTIDQIKEGVRKMEQTEEGRKASASLKKSYEEYKKSKPSTKSKFADGGKFQDFICKHARGGDIDCNCSGGTVVRAAEGEQIPPRSVRRAASRNMESAPDTETASNRRIGYTDMDGNQTVYEDAIVNGGSTETWATATPQGDTIVVQKFPIRGGTAVRTYPEGSNQYNRVMSRLRGLFNRDPERQSVHIAPQISIFPGLTSSGEVTNSLQEGGELTRKQALTGAQWAMGRGISPVSRDTARLAYINAKNALRNNSDLRGRDLRQAAREMISRPPQAPVPEMAQIDFNTLNNGTTLSPIEDPQFIEEPMFTDEELNQMGDQAVNNAMSSLSRNTRNRDNNAIAGAVQHFATIAPSTVGAVNYEGYRNPGQNFKDMWNHFTSLFKKEQGGQIEKHQNGNGIIDHYRNKWSNDWDNIKLGWNNFKDSAFGLIIPTSGEELLMSAVPMGKPIYTGAKAAKAAGKVKITPNVKQGITETAGGPLLEFEGDLIKIRPGLTPAQREKARELAYKIADSRALRKSLPRDLDDAYGMTNGPWSSTFGRNFKLSELNK